MVVSFTGLGSSEPDSVLSVVRGNERNDFFEVKFFACLVVSFVLGLIQGFED